MATIGELTELLSDLTFPATREQIIAHARQTGATEDVIDDLRTLPNEEYVDRMDVWDRLGLIQEEPAPRPADNEIPTEESDILTPRWQCPGCEVTFATEGEYRQHMQHDHEEEPVDIEL
jgi:hypothetical protein